MQHRLKKSYRSLYLLIALSFFWLPFSVNGIRAFDNVRTNLHIDSFDLPDHAVYGIVRTVSSEELLAADIPRITRYTNSKGINQPKGWLYYLNYRLSFLTAVFIIYVLISHTGNVVFFSRKYIIKYIHDQDGHKIMCLRFMYTA
jgi:hypothetical protein